MESNYFYNGGNTPSPLATVVRKLIGFRAERQINIFLSVSAAFLLKEHHEDDAWRGKQ